MSLEHEDVHADLGYSREPRWAASSSEKPKPKARKPRAFTKTPAPIRVEAPTERITDPKEIAAGRAAVAAAKAALPPRPVDPKPAEVISVPALTMDDPVPEVPRLMSFNETVSALHRAGEAPELQRDPLADVPLRSHRQ